MASKHDDSRFDADQPRRDDPELTVLERVQELTWALLDGEISDDEMSLLDTLLLTGDAARNRYIDCVQLHTDLMAHYSEPRKSESNAGSRAPVLSFSNAGPSSVDMPSPRPAE